MPLKIVPNKNQNELPYKVVRLHERIHLDDIKDEFADNEPTDLYEILSKIFLIDGRIYKHYRLLPWFPQYMKQLYRSQLLLMDNNDCGEEQFMS